MVIRPFVKQDVCVSPFLDPVVCVICAKLAKDNVEDTANEHYFHWINFIFVKGKFQVRKI